MRPRFELRSRHSLLLLLSAIFLMGLFSPPIRDSDFWWHFKTGQYLWQHHALPDPDPFAFTTASAAVSYPGELVTRRLNLTHEWLAQLLIYLVYAVAGFPGIVLARAALLSALCALVGWTAFRRTAGFDRSLAAALATAAVVLPYALDRPYLVTFLFVAVTLAILESRSRRWLWVLPPLYLVWANCHAGFFLGWVILAAWCAQTGIRRWQGRAEPGDRALWLASVLAVAASAANPNGFSFLAVLLHYRQSFLQSTLLEWQRPALWPPGVFAILLALAAGVLFWRRREVEPRDALLFAAFAVASLMAGRNVPLTGIVAPVLLAAYLPWKWQPPRLAGYALMAVFLGIAAVGTVRGSFFQFRVADWHFPSGAADFLQAHRIAGPMFNTYEYGGYLMWRLWPQQRVFIDGRALSESVFFDYARILYNHDATGGSSAGELLDRYGIQVIVMNALEYGSGAVYNLAPSLADPSQTTWKLVYGDAAALVFLRNPPAGVPALSSLQVLSSMEDQCSLHLEHEPDSPLCARSLADVFDKVGDGLRARRWLAVYRDAIR